MCARVLVLVVHCNLYFDGQIVTPYSLIYLP